MSEDRRPETAQHAVMDSYPDITHKSSREQAVQEANLDRSPTDESTLRDFANSPTSGKDNSPTEASTANDWPISPALTTETDKPHPDVGSKELNNGATQMSHLSKPFRFVHAGLQKTGVFHVPAIRRIWSQVCEIPAEALVGQEGPSDPTWRTTWMRLGPLSGIFCMLLAVSTMVASLGVLVGSNGHAVDSWSAPPSTYLAVFTAIANLGMRYACLQGVVIAWWVRAGRGSTMGKLHHDWRSGTTLRGALTAGRHTGLLGLACIFSTLVVIDGPLLQRSSTVITGSVSPRPVSLNVTMAQEIPTGWSGNWLTGDELGANDPRWTSSYNSTMPAGNRNVSNEIWCAVNHGIDARLGRLYFSDAPLAGIYSGCAKQQCRAVLRAPALAQKSCVATELPVDFTSAALAAPNLQGSYPRIQQSAFSVANALIPKGRESIGLTTAFSWTTDCKGALTMTSCELLSAIGDYNVTIEDDVATLDEPVHPNIVAVANNTAVNDTLNPQTMARDSTLAGLVNLHWERWVSDVQMSIHDGVTTALASTAEVFDVYMRNATSDCPSFDDPHADTIASLNKLMVYAGLVAGQEEPSYLASRTDPGLAVNTTTTGHLTGTESVYHTDFRFFAAAIIVELVCVILVAPTYWDWWKLGRAVSFSPLEIAKAFESPLLADYNSNSSARDIARSTGDSRIQYGVVSTVDSTETGTKLAFADPSAVSKPSRGMLIDA